MVLTEVESACFQRLFGWEHLWSACLCDGFFVFGWSSFFLVRVALVQQSVEASSIPFREALC